VTFLEKVRLALRVTRDSKGMRQRLRTLRRFIRLALHNRAGNPSHDPTADVELAVWAEHTLLTFTDRAVNVRLDARGENRIWFILPELDPTMIFGGYIALFQFIAHLQAKGLATGLIIQKNVGTKASLQEAFRQNHLVHEVIKRAAMTSLGVSHTLRLHPNDALVAYNWTTALIAQKACQFLHDRNFHYFVQEDERIFYPNDSTRYLAESVFHFKPRLICNSAALRAHFEREGLLTPDMECAVFEQGIPVQALPDVNAISTRKTRKLLFYGRPEDHAKRNLFTIAIMALEKAIANGAFPADEWTFYMMGSKAMGDNFSVGGRKVNCLPKMGYADYLAALPTFDLGMCLMYAPHPSVPPVEMVRAGLVTVVNQYRDRDSAWYADISANFVVGSPTAQGIAATLEVAADKVNDGPRRVAAACSYHPSSWDESFASATSQLRHPAFRIANQLAA
jgi:hypothetical protein